MNSLLEAIDESDIKHVGQILHKCNEIDYQEALIKSAENGDLDIFKIIYAKACDNTDISMDFDNNIIIKTAAENNSCDILKYAVSLGANINTSNYYALTVSASAGFYSVVKYLLKKGTNVHIDDDKPLRKSAENGHLDVVKILLEYGADIHSLNDFALRAAHLNNHKEVVSYLITKGANTKVLNR